MSTKLVDEKLSRALRGLIKERHPWTLANRDWTGTTQEVVEWANPAGYDFAWYGAIGHFLAISPHIMATREAVDVDDVESLKWRAWLSRRPKIRELPEYSQRLIELPMWRGIERSVSPQVDAMILSAPDDLQAFCRRGLPNAFLVPNTYPDPGRITDRAVADPPVLGFVANYGHPPNREAAHILATEVLPIFRRMSPGARVRLIGYGAESIAELSTAPGVDVVGAVTDVSAHIKDVLALVMPIRFGGGTRLKALEAFAMGVPVISTGLGVAGLEVADGQAYLNAETPDEFAGRAQHLLSNPDLEAQLTQNARTHYEHKFTTAASAKAVSALIHNLAST